MSSILSDDQASWNESIVDRSWQSEEPDQNAVEFNVKEQWI